MRKGVHNRKGPMIPPARPALGEEEYRAVREVLESGMLAQGPRVEAFETAFARYVGRRHAIATSSGTAALHIALLALGQGPGDEIVMPPMTFMACASMTLAVGGRPSFADVENRLFTLDPRAAAKAVTPATRALMPVHLYGQTATMDPLKELAAERDLWVIEDACQAHGALYKGRQAGGFGDVSCFSFYSTKNMVTGEGGMVLTDDDEVAEACRLLRDHGQVTKYHHSMVGYNYRMTEMAAAIGFEQLKKLPGFLRRRRHNADRLRGAVEGVKGLLPPTEGADRTHSYYQFIVQVLGHPLGRDGIVARLNEEGIGARPSYPMPLYQQEALVKAGIKGRCPVAEASLPSLFELPVHPLVTDEDLERIGGVLGALA